MNTLIYHSLRKLNVIILLMNHFTIENNLMTPTMKVRRHEVEKIYSEVINGMF
jgi:long-subunit acyl-CoA synthetase (AMP-forming)